MNWHCGHSFIASLLKGCGWGSKAVGCKRSEKPCLQDYTDQAEQTTSDFSFHEKTRMTKKDMFSGSGEVIRIAGQIGEIAARA
jgi:hypothetical protein